MGYTGNYKYYMISMGVQRNYEKINRKKEKKGKNKNLSYTISMEVHRNLKKQKN